MCRIPKMLLIDDDGPLVQTLTRSVGRLIGEKFTLTAMTDSLAARHWICGNSPDLVLTDLQMPAVTGFDIVECARRSNPACQVIVYSGHISPEALHLALRLGAVDYIEKAADWEDLEQALRSACDRVVRWNQALPERVTCVSVP